MPHDDIQNLLDTASALLDSGRLSDALELYLKILSQDPDHFDACLMAGSIQGELGQLAEAAQSLRHAVQLRPADVAGSLTLAHVLRARHDLPSAIDTLLGTVRAGANDEDLYCTLGSMQNESGQLTAAADSFARAVQINDGNPRAWSMLGFLLGRTGSRDRAVAAYYKALEFDPDNQDTAAALAELLVALGRFSEAEKQVLPAAGKYPDNFELQYQAAIALTKQGRHGEALQYSKRAVAIRPDSESTLAQHFDILEKHGDNEQAFELIRPFLESDTPPLWAALAFAKLSPVFDTRDDCRYLLDKIAQRPDLTAEERISIQSAYDYMEQKEY